MATPFIALAQRLCVLGEPEQGKVHYRGARSRVRFGSLADMCDANGNVLRPIATGKADMKAGAAARKGATPAGRTFQPWYTGDHAFVGVVIREGLRSPPASACRDPWPAAPLLRPGRCASDVCSTLYWIIPSFRHSASIAATTPTTNREAPHMKREPRGWHSDLFPEINFSSE